MFDQITPNSEVLEGVAGLAMTSELFSEEIERRISSGEEESYIEAIASYIEDLDQDASDMKHFISPTLIGKIEAEARKRGMLKEKHTTSDLTKMFE
jgi:hypothetical protein